ncbi:hypothetical protein TVAG_007140 [Trichomonas vaginalis G3]|uniref:Uncharacterized protein n=1 Tax=Trichomonas vaginalis (strain ATCC PRA-98 / G3) TaxID=412133 RepID=A2F4H5_TRIV3|nr:hypothetical protein TVAGG3_0421980 [Trichomonas vaginalis G3]EAY00184.1 hypothetical protein TVAG_007140 [Trichomonas vaginalis G3]KAI5536136.1 hypothetical protein TVAGG3_0421980 [Trichomonas vaginalis G3]|eukprot:XP_001313113.1 hypothetical protein [Trichomonas vaginalis G3]
MLLLVLIVLILGPWLYFKPKWGIIATILLLIYGAGILTGSLLMLDPEYAIPFLSQATGVGDEKMRELLEKMASNNKNP